MSDQPPDDDAPDGDLPPLSVLVDMLDDVIKLLDGVADLVTDHRRVAGDDHHALARLQHVSIRVNQAWTSVLSARAGLRS
jgi:hypothetical protein